MSPRGIGINLETGTCQKGTPGESGYYPSRSITSGVSFFAELTRAETS